MSEKMDEAERSEQHTTALMLAYLDLVFSLEENGVLIRDLLVRNLSESKRMLEDDKEPNRDGAEMLRIIIKAVSRKAQT